MGTPRMGPPPKGKKMSIPKAQRRMKIYDLDEALVMYKKFRDIVKLRDLLEMSQGHVLNVHALGKLRGKFQLARNKRLTTYPESHPGVVKLTTDSDGWQWLEFTDEAEDLIAERGEYIRNVHEPMCVTWIRKLLMMSQTRTLPVSRIQFLQNVLYLPHDFRTRMIHEYPQYFRVTHKGIQQVLELVEWDDELAVTYREKRMKENALELDELMGDTNPHAFPMSFPRGFHLRRKVREYYEEFQKLPFQSPYEICRTSPGTMEAEKRNLAIVHELLSMFVEKRAQISQISILRMDYKMTPRIRQLIERFQGIFYTSYKEDLFTVFLKEGYSGMRLIDRSRLLEFRDRFIKLCLIEPGRMNPVPSLSDGPYRRRSPYRIRDDKIEQRVKDIGVYDQTVGRIDDEGKLQWKGLKKTLTRCLAGGEDVEILGENEEEMVHGKPRIRFEKSLEENSGYNIVELEKSLNEFGDEAANWPSHNGICDDSDFEW